MHNSKTTAESNARVSRFLDENFIMEGISNSDYTD